MLQERCDLQVYGLIKFPSLFSEKLYLWNRETVKELCLLSNKFFIRFILSVLYDWGWGYSSVVGHLINTQILSLNAVSKKTTTATKTDQKQANKQKAQNVPDQRQPSTTQRTLNFQCLCLKIKGPDFKSENRNTLSTWCLAFQRWETVLPKHQCIVGSAIWF